MRAKDNGRKPIIMVIWCISMCMPTFGCGRQEGGKRLPEVSVPTQAATLTSAANPAPDPTLHVPFRLATREEVPVDGERPPDLTFTGKSVGKLYTKVVEQWDTVTFTNPEGKKIRHTALLDTELGRIEIELRSDIAPNHVRNFIALSRSGFYDGLVFERAIHSKQVDKPEIRVEVLEGGCPLGSGDFGVGGLGYWLRAEVSKESHEEGTVGMCHGLDIDTACCRFYITLNKAPFLDGNFTIFGKVTAGLDVARRIFSLPVRSDAEYPEGDRPEKPVVIQKVTIKEQTQS